MVFKSDEILSEKEFAENRSVIYKKYNFPVPVIIMSEEKYQKKGWTI